MSVQFDPIKPLGFVMPEDDGYKIGFRELYQEIVTMKAELKNYVQNTAVDLATINLRVTQLENSNRTKWHTVATVIGWIIALTAGAFALFVK